MFESLRDMTPDAVDVAADQLRRGHLFGALVDPSGAIVMFVPRANHEVDFALVTRVGRELVPLSLSNPLHFAVVHAWTERSVKSICQRWIELDRAAEAGS